MKRIAIIIAAIIVAIAILCATCPAGLVTVAHAMQTKGMRNASGDARQTEVILDSETGLGIDENTVLWTPDC